MAIDLTNTLIVAISATALFDLSESENHLLQLLKQRPISAVKEFRDYMAERENDPLTIGAGYPLIKALLNLNNYPELENSNINSPLVEVVIISKSSPDTGIQVLNAIREHGLNISRSAI